MAVFCRNRRAHSETDPVSGTIERDFSSDHQRSHSTSDLTSGRIDENSLFDISPLPLDLSERVRGSDGAHEAPCFLESPLQTQRVSVSSDVNEFDRNGRKQHSTTQAYPGRVDQLSETETIAANHSQGTPNIRPKYNNLSDFLDEILEIDTSEGRHLNVPARQQIAMEVSSALSNATFDLSNCLTTASAVSYTSTSSVTPCVTWSNQSCVLYSSCRNSFDYHSHSHLDQNLNCALRNPTSGPEVIPRQYALSTGHLGKTQPMGPGENRFPSCSHMGEGDSCHANQSVNFRDSLDPRQRSQCLLPVQRIRREALEYAGHYLLRRRSNAAGPGVSSKVTSDGPRQREHRHGFDTGKTHRRMRSNEKAGSFGESWTENSDVKNKEVKKKESELPTTRKFAHSERYSTADVTPKPKSEIEDASPKQGAPTSTSNTTNMLLGVDDMAMLSEDQVSLLRQLEEDKSLLFDFEVFQGTPVTSESEMNIISGPNRSLLAQPMTPPGGSNPEHDGIMSPGSDFQALENYYPPSQPSPASTVVSEQEMIEAYELVMEEVLTTIIRRLGISADPLQWTCEHVQAWISLLHQEYGRPEVNLYHFQVDGDTLCRMSQEDLEQRAPGSGYLLHSNLNCLLKMNHMEDIKPVISQSQQQQHQQQQYQPQTMAPHPMGYDANIMYAPFSMPQMSPPSPAMLSEKDLGPSSVGSSASSDEDEQSMTSPVPSPSGPNTSMTPHHTGAIQLWQFLQELLLQPDSYNYCIRFLDRTQGIFKIEDSVEVARLWGMRKNRPAMNYDKLSRSIRQYYKKGIMKKTEISQRLVYQFVKPF